MKATLEVHKIQRHILVSLLLKPKQTFGKLNIEKIATDHFNFHLQSLVESGLVVKTKEGYELTAIGKEFGNRFDTEKVQIEKQAKVSVLLVCQREQNGRVHYLIQRRLKQPFYGHHGFPGGKVRYGETIYEAAKRELSEETGLEGSLAVVGVKHKMDYSPEGTLLEDKVFLIFKVTNVKGSYIENFGEGMNIWLSKKEIMALPNLFDGVEETLTMSKSNSLQFVETKYTVTGF